MLTQLVRQAPLQKPLIIRFRKERTGWSALAHMYVLTPWLLLFENPTTVTSTYKCTYNYVYKST